MYVRKIVLKRVDADISERVCIPLSSTKVAIPSRKVTMAILDNISQRRRNVTFSGNSLYSIILIHKSHALYIKDSFGPADRLLSVRKKVNMHHERVNLKGYILTEKRYIPMIHAAVSCLIPYG